MGVAYCLDAGTIKAGLEILAGEKIHPTVAFFLDLAHYRTLHNLDPGTPVNVPISELCKNYEVNNGPAKKPLLIPFKDRNAKGVKGLFRNGNIAGSFAKSSMRSTNSKQSLTDDDGHFRYPVDASGFLKERLGGVRPATWAIAAFYLRNAVFVFEDSHEPGVSDLISAFRKSYGLESLNEFDDSAVVPESIFVPANLNLGDEDSYERLDLGRGISVDLYQRRRVPALIASDIVASVGDPRDGDTTDVVKRMLDEFGGVILVGPPGTSKSHTAQRIADDLTGGNDACQFYVQFHSSYQYEDFMEGFRPTESGGFVRKEGSFLQACDMASRMPGDDVVLVIDEISRADVGRVFGEALTYIETSKRDSSFLLLSGRETKVPSNLKIVATMNSLDRGANDIDEAFGRRFAFLDVPPSVELLDSVLASNVDSKVRDNIKSWMEEDLELSKEEPRAAVGHAFFVGIQNDYDAKRRWKYQLERYLSHALVGRPDTFSQLVSAWEQRFPNDGAQ